MEEDGLIPERDPIQELVDDIDWDALPGPDSDIPVFDGPPPNWEVNKPQKPPRVRTEYQCPHCHAELDPRAIPDQVLLSERGRRNWAKRRPEIRAGKSRVWRWHNPNAPHCLCWDCQWARLREKVERFHKNLAAHVQMTNGDPWWADTYRETLQTRQEELLAALEDGVVPPERLNI